MADAIKPSVGGGKPAAARPQKKSRNMNSSHVKRVLREATGGQYRISKDVVGFVAKHIDKSMRDLAQEAAYFAQNAGRSTIKAKDVQAAIERPKKV